MAVVPPKTSTNVPKSSAAYFCMVSMSTSRDGSLGVVAG
jgi:hypothetical protein